MPNEGLDGPHKRQVAEPAWTAREVTTQAPAVAAPASGARGGAEDANERTCKVRERAPAGDNEATRRLSGDYVVTTNLTCRAARRPCTSPAPE